ncbi:hypothetical protein [Acetivibrio mesophilus]|uniref:Uncharacterized protein n=1 Tax=Acetivibrio mesophilus TaxID=2487273 RepID=A0A4Q0I572_9FIRM|nr:hypothetical protein [Acetivibrio mesophilus]ODM27478.1 hypothetical protein A7W90_15345 [Clostridium sp. Bc-iso-3]RXE59438.1 hypothetical protein EFD62_07235 [Acetivibrio mesophilus]HHV30226.1 hypothetical protein [Clostridium sp.]
MVCDDTKRVVVIRNITSNFIEEAILILKRNPDEGGGRKSKKVLPKDREKMNEHLLKEAEEIINNYIKRYGSQDDCGTELRLKPYRIKARIPNIVINMALLGSIGLLIFLVSRFL